jgi:hypothetical protein
MNQRDRQVSVQVFATVDMCENRTAGRIQACLSEGGEWLVEDERTGEQHHGG